MKECTKCGETKALDAFGPSKRHKDGRRSECRICYRAYLQAWKDSNHEKVRAGKRSYYEANKERIKGANLTRYYENREQILAQKRAWNADNPDEVRSRNLMAKFRITLDEWNQLFDTQGRRCAVCGSAETTGRGWHTDHDRSCCPRDKTCGNCIRGITCHECNTALGMMHDDTSRLQMAIDYLNSRKGE